MAAHAVRDFIDNKAAKKQCESGTGTVASVPSLRSKVLQIQNFSRVWCG